MQFLRRNVQSLNKLKDWILRFRYVLSLGFFLVYMLFFDQYRIPIAYSIYKDVQQLEQEKEDYVHSLRKLAEDKRDFEENYEKFAREKYFMSRPDEDVFIIK
ncbi:MAG: hypothetical protein KBF37_03020 [Saprospiraceae bacterium]|jgi:cell division protein DivIC|nr:hypothetical protein [Saprospiraceae bacterium]MBP9209272.1 hypothetical protein [Saprospiraceae bacterium]MBV6473048.1 hypothetical protein [Saprospiraceae bacterium]